MTTIASTFVSQIWNDNEKTFSDYVDGSTDCTGKNDGPLKNVQSLWAMYGRWNPQVYDLVASANGNSLGQLQRSVPLLWTKNARQLGNDRVWRRTLWS